MEASIVDAIGDLKEALLGKLDEIVLSGKPSWPASLQSNLTTPVSRPSHSHGSYSTTILNPQTFHELITNFYTLFKTLQVSDVGA